jgi:hypothetical protein
VTWFISSEKTEGHTSVNPGDLVTILYETVRYYLVLGPLGRDYAGEERMELIGTDGKIRYVFKSEIKVLSEAR